ncbi:hypothetical protein ES705_10412 [subsurface metagenome]|nr:hypothetical protein [Clostridia bacterium]
MKSTSNGILNNIILSLLLFAMLLQIGCAYFLTGKYGGEKIQGIEIKGKISSLEGKGLWAAKYEEECYRSNIDKICENLEIALFQKNEEEDIFLAKTEFDSEGTFYMTIPELQMQLWYEQMEPYYHYKEYYVAPADFYLVVNELEKNSYVNPRKINFTINWYERKDSTKSLRISSNAHASLYPPSDSLYALGIKIELYLELSMAGNSLFTDTRNKMIIEEIKKIEYSLKFLDADYTWTLLDSISKYTYSSSFPKELKDKISNIWVKLGSSGLKINDELWAYKTALNINSENKIARNKLAKARKLIEGKIVEAALKYKAVNYEATRREYDLKYRTLSKDIQRKTEELQKYNEKALLPIVKEFSTLLETYSDIFGDVALRDLAIKYNFLDLLR